MFNFGPPPKDEDYIHRIGRTGRAGRSGQSFTLVSPADEKSWGFVLKMIKQDVKDFMPDGLLDELAWERGWLGDQPLPTLLVAHDVDPGITDWSGSYSRRIRAPR